MSVVCNGTFQPNPLNDTSRHDWMLGVSCFEAGITESEELAAILMSNPHGKYRRDMRADYVRVTVGKVLGREFVISKGRLRISQS